MMKLTAADGHEFGVFEAGNVNAPRGLVVLQEIFGVNRHMRSVSEHLAQYGYRVLCPALYDRAERDVERGRRLRPRRRHRRSDPLLDPVREERRNDHLGTDCFGLA